ncbi:hypothetical protein U9M48_014101 [Paspalum notatum var. saurae]|uniref:Uncharacterized protein n=1 Tax=Paspalum notatum var. saurae TaxID=547442 RepID=A0AAQ3T198_PASNO
MPPAPGAANQQALWRSPAMKMAKDLRSSELSTLRTIGKQTLLATKFPQIVEIAGLKPEGTCGGLKSHVGQKLRI